MSYPNAYGWFVGDILCSSGHLAQSDQATIFPGDDLEIFTIDENGYELGVFSIRDDTVEYVRVSHYMMAHHAHKFRVVKLTFEKPANSSLQYLASKLLQAAFEAGLR